MDKTITVGQKWLVNELVLSFWALKKSAKAQSNLMILSKVIAVTNDDDNEDDNDNDDDNRQTETVVKPVFCNQGVSKRGDLMKTEGVKFYTNLILSLMRM